MVRVFPKTGPDHQPLAFALKDSAQSRKKTLFTTASGVGGNEQNLLVQLATQLCNLGLIKGQQEHPSEAFPPCRKTHKPRLGAPRLDKLEQGEAG